MELLIATSVSGVLAMGVLAAANMLYADYEVNRFNQRLSSWTLNIEGLFLVRSDYQNLSLQAVVDTGLLDDEDVTFQIMNDKQTTTVINVRHLFGGSLNIGVPSKLPSQFWAIHLAGLPTGSRCMPLLQHAVNVGHVVAVVNETDLGAVSDFSDWKDAVSYSNALNEVDNFPGKYKIIRQQGGLIMPLSDMINFCNRSGMRSMGLALIRRKM
jgi:hypothetical protein